MQRRTSQRSIHNPSRTSSNQDFILQHMSNHYRRILNAKKVIDTSPPYCFKSKSSRVNKTPSALRCIKTSKSSINKNFSPILTDRSLPNSSYKGSSWGTESCIASSRYHASCVPDSHPQPKVVHIDMALLDRITYDTKNPPAVYCDKNYIESKQQQNEKKASKPVEVKENTSEQKPQGNPKRRLPPKVTEPKQKRVFPLQIESKNQKSGECKCTDICICGENYLQYKKTPPDVSKDNKNSSRDSAYNGGVSSLPESRSPTPDQQNKQITYSKNNSCTCDEKPDFPEKDFDKSAECLSDNEYKFPKSNTYPLLPKLEVKEEDGDSLRKLKEDALYIKFIQDITVEVLEKHIYTNKALKKVMKKHLIQNLKKLDKNRMIKEVDNLRIQLKIPEDESLFDLDSHASDSAADLTNTGSIISDSEFTIPESLMLSLENEDPILREEIEMSPTMSKSLIKPSRKKRMTAEDETSLTNDTESSIGSESIDEVIDYISVTETERGAEETNRTESDEKNIPSLQSCLKESGDDSDELAKWLKKSENNGKVSPPKKCSCYSSDKNEKLRMLEKKVSISMNDNVIVVNKKNSKGRCGSGKTGMTNLQLIGENISKDKIKKK